MLGLWLLVVSTITDLPLPLTSNPSNIAGCEGTDCDGFQGTLFCRRTSWQAPKVSWEDHVLEGHKLTIHFVTRHTKYHPGTYPATVPIPSMLQYTLTATGSDDIRARDHLNGRAYCEGYSNNMDPKDCHTVTLINKGSFTVQKESGFNPPCLRLILPASNSSDMSVMSLHWEGDLDPLVYQPASNPLPGNWLDAPPRKLSADDFPLAVFRYEFNKGTDLPPFTVSWEGTDEKADFYPYSKAQCDLDKDCVVAECGSDSYVVFLGSSWSETFANSLDTSLRLYKYPELVNKDYYTHPMVPLPFNGTAMLWSTRGKVAEWVCVKRDTSCAAADFSKAIVGHSKHIQLPPRSPTAACWNMNINKEDGYLIVKVWKFLTRVHTMDLLLDGAKVESWTSESVPYYNVLLPSGSVSTATLQTSLTLFPPKPETDADFQLHFEPYSNITSTFGLNTTTSQTGSVINFKYLTILCNTTLYLQYDGSYLFLASTLNESNTFLIDTLNHESKVVQDGNYAPFADGGVHVYYFDLNGDDSFSDSVLKWTCESWVSPTCRKLTTSNSIGVQYDIVNPNVNECWELDCGDHPIVFSINVGTPKGVIASVANNGVIVSRIPIGETPTVNLSPGNLTVYVKGGDWFPTLTRFSFSARCLPKELCLETDETWGEVSLLGGEALGYCINVICDGELSLSNGNYAYANGFQVSEHKQTVSYERVTKITFDNEIKPILYNRRSTVVWVCIHKVMPPCETVAVDTLSTVSIPRIASPACWTITCPHNGALSIAPYPFDSHESYIPDYATLKINGQGLSYANYRTLEKNVVGDLRLATSKPGVVSKPGFTVLLRCTGQEPTCIKLNATAKPRIVGCGGVTCTWWCTEIVCPAGETVWHRKISGDTSHLKIPSPGKFKFTSTTKSISLLVGCDVSSPAPVQLPLPMDDVGDCEDLHEVIPYSSQPTYSRLNPNTLCYLFPLIDNTTTVVKAEAYREIPGDNWVNVEVIRKNGSQVYSLPFIVTYDEPVLVKVRMLFAGKYKGPTVRFTRQLPNIHSRSIKKLSASSTTTTGSTTAASRQCQVFGSEVVTASFKCSGNYCLDYCLEIRCEEKVFFIFDKYDLQGRALMTSEFNDEYKTGDTLPSKQSDMKVLGTSLWIDFENDKVASFSGQISGSWACGSSNRPSNGGWNPTPVPVAGSSSDGKVIYARVFFYIPHFVIWFVVIIIIAYVRYDQEMKVRMFRARDVNVETIADTDAAGSKPQEMSETPISISTSNVN
eukprot:TRINITY_DN1574_c0_g1_i3.p1 TRINITY_DN1574_c0_g1~~TRINITY_DN1574_c0_g1_i3.p1  ORF type:complete len:1272 (+),score=201.78 TRINITY_DN1574_c0_g1_i3:57-3818(+)